MRRLGGRSDPQRHVVQARRVHPWPRSSLGCVLRELRLVRPARRQARSGPCGLRPPRERGRLMPKIRAVKPEFWTDDEIVELSAFARLLYIGLWNLACDNGHV